MSHCVPTSKPCQLSKRLRKLASRTAKARTASLAQSRSSSINNNATSRLLRLPAELRNKIYHHTLTASEGQHVELTAIKQHSALLRTCSQIRKEATDIFYANNTFVITDCLAQLAEINYLVKNVGGSNKLISKVVVHIKLPKAAADVLPRALIEDQAFQQQFHLPMEERQLPSPLLRAWWQIRDEMFPEIRQCAEDLVFYGGIDSSKIVVKRCCPTQEQMQDQDAVTRNDYVEYLENVFIGGVQKGAKLVEKWDKFPAGEGGQIKKACAE